MNILGKRGPLDGESFGGGDITDVGEIETGIGVVDDYLHLLPSTNGAITTPTSGVHLFAEADQYTYTYRDSKKRRLAEMTPVGALEMDTFASTPAASDVGTVLVYANTSDRLSYINSAGIVSTLLTDNALDPLIAEDVLINARIDENALDITNLDDRIDGVDVTLTGKLDTTAQTDLDMNAKSITNCAGLTLDNQQVGPQLTVLNAKTQNMSDAGSSTVFTGQLVVDGGTNPRIRTDKITNTGGFTSVDMTNSILTITPGQGNPTTVSTAGLTTPAVLLPGGDVQSQLDNLSGGATSGLALKMDKVATTNLDMSGLAILNAGGIVSTGTVTTGSVVPDGLTNVSDIGQAIKKYRDIYLHGTVNAGAVDCPGNVLTGNVIPKTANKDVGTVTSKYRNAYLAGTVDAAAVTLPGGDVQTQITQNASDITALSGSTTTGLNNLNIKTQNISAIVNDTTLSGRLNVPAVIETPLIRNPANTSTLALNNDDLVLASNSKSIKVDVTGLTVNDDAYVNGVVYTDQIRTQATGPPTIGLVEDDFSGTLKGGALLNGTQTGYPLKSNGLVQLVDEASYTSGLEWGSLTYDTQVIGSLTNTFSVKWTGYFTDLTPNTDGVGFYMSYGGTRTGGIVGTANSYSVLFNSGSNEVIFWYNNAFLAAFSMTTLTPAVDHIFEVRVFETVGVNTKFEAYYDNVLQRTYTHNTWAGHGGRYVGVNAYLGGQPNMSSWFMRDILIDTIPSTTTPGTTGAGAAVGLSGTALDLSMASTEITLTEDSILLSNGPSTIGMNPTDLRLSNVNGVIVENNLIATNVWPSANNAWDIGYDAIRYKDMYLSGSVISNAANITGLATTQKMVPQTNNAHDIGETALRYNNAYLNTLDAKYIVKRFVNGWYNLSESVTQMGTTAGQWSAIYSGNVSTTTSDFSYDPTRMRVFSWDLDPGWYTPRLQYGYDGVVTFPPRYLTTAVVETAVFEVHICLVMQNVANQQQQVIIAAFKNSVPDAITTNQTGILQQSVAHIALEADTAEPKIFTTTFLAELQNADNLIIRMTPYPVGGGGDVRVRGLKWTATQV